MRHLFAALAALLLSACMGLLNPGDEISTTLHEYNDGVRWNRLDQAVIHLPPADRHRFVERHTGLDDQLEILDVEIQRVDVDRAKKSAEAQVDVTWSLKNRGLVEHTVVDQSWRSRDGQWVMEKETRVKGSPLAIFDEPEGKDHRPPMNDALPGAAANAPTGGRAP